MTKLTQFVVIGLFFLGYLSAPEAAVAAAGSLDATFGRSGRVITDIKVVEAPFVSAMDAALDASGRIVVAASAGKGNIASVARFLSTGARDKSFGDAGVAQFPFALAFDSVSLAVQSNGQVLVGGSTIDAKGITAFALAKYTANGVLDRSFGSSGTVLTSFPGLNAMLEVILVEPNGDILASGSSSTVALPSTVGAVVTRYTSAGSLDDTFGSEGVVTLPAVSSLSALALLSNGRILFTSNSIGIALNPNGTVTESVLPAVAVSQVGSVAFQSNGELLSAVQVETQRNGETTAVAVTRTFPNGSTDPSFSAPLFYFNSGVEFVEFSQEIPYAVAVSAAGQVLVGGSSALEAGPSFGVARLNADGSLDLTFGGTGTVTTPLAGNGAVQKLLVQPDGKIVAVGSAGPDLALVRYLGQ